MAIKERERKFDLAEGLGEPEPVFYKLVKDREENKNA